MLIISEVELKKRSCCHDNFLFPSHLTIKSQGIIIILKRSHNISKPKFSSTNPVAQLTTNRVGAIVVTKPFCGLHETLLYQKPTTSAHVK